MATTTDAGTIARALYETLIGTVLDQLRAVAPKLAEISDSDPTMQQRIEAALPTKPLPEVRNFLLALAREGALDQLPAIVKAFESYSSARAQVLSAEVTSAVPLSQAQKDQIAQELRQRADAELDLRFSVDETLIGGLIIRIGDQVLDNSLRTRLGAVQRTMLSS